MKKTAILIHLISVSFLLNAQWVQTNGPHGEEINCIESYGNDIYVGNVYGVYKSTNNGDTWQYKPCSHVRALARSGNNLFVGKSNGEVLLSTDDGSTWTSRSTGLPLSNFINVITFKGDSIYAGTERDGLFLSTNNGNSWNQVVSEFHNREIFDIKIDTDGRIFVACEYGLYVSLDYGLTWNNIFAGYNYENFCFAIDNGVLYAGKYYYSYDSSYVPSVYVSLDYGNNWSSISNGVVMEKIHCIEIGIAGEIIVGTEGSGIFISSDNGATWAAFNNGLTNSFARVLHAKDSTVFLGTMGYEKSGLFRTDNSFSNWELTGVQSTTINALTSFGGYILAGTTEHGIYMTNDKGDTWFPKNDGLNYFTVKAIAHNTAGNIFIAANRVFVSEDTCNSWTNRSNGIPSGVNVISLYTAGNKVIAGTTDGGLFLSDNEGHNWHVANTGLPNHDITAVAFIGDTLFAGTEYGHFFLSLDNGNTWSPSNFYYFYRIRSIHLRQNVIYVTTDNSIFKSSDYGNTWISLCAGQSFAFDQTGNFFSSNYGMMFFSSDSGASWNEESTGLFPGSFFNAMCTDDQYIYAGRGGSGVWRRQIVEMVNVESTRLNETEIRLFPNPVSEILFVKFLSESDVENKIELYDIQGKKLHVFQTRESEVKVDVSGIPAGLYFITVSNKESRKCYKVIKM